MKVKTKDITNLFLISDIHFGVKSDNLEWEENIRGYFKNFFIPLLQEKGNEHSAICVLGDLFDNRDAINIRTMNVVIELITELAKSHIVLILTGNHDMFKRSDSLVSSLAMLKNIPNVEVISETKDIVFGDKDNKVKTTWVPYSGDHFKESEILQSSKSDFVFMHTDMLGMKMDNNRLILSGTNYGLFKGQKVYSGHIHKRQESDKVTYIGSPYHLNRSDIGNVKGIYQIILRDYSEVFHQNTYSPTFKKIPYKKLREYKKDEIQDFFNNSYVDVLLDKDEINTFSPNAVLDILEPNSYKRVEFIVQQDDVETLNENECNLADIKLFSIRELIKKHLDKELEKHSELNKEEKDLIYVLHSDLVEKII